MPLLFTIFFTFFLQNQTWALSVPALTSPVVDTANVIQKPEAEALRQALQNIRSQGGPQVTVLTIASLGRVPIEDYSFEVARKWGLGGEKQDDGVLLLIAVKDRKLRIEVGQGLEGDLTDAYSKRIIDYDITPHFRSGNFTQGIVMGVRGILLRMNPPLQLEDYTSDGQLRSLQEPDTKSVLIYNLFIFGIIFFFFILPALTGGSGRGGRGGGNIPIFIPGSGGRSGRGGGWSGGGGGFSGGGASGSW